MEKYFDQELKQLQDNLLFIPIISFDTTPLPHPP